MNKGLILLMSTLLIITTGYSQQYFNRRYELNGCRGWDFSPNILQDSYSYILQFEGPNTINSNYRRIAFQKLDLLGNLYGPCMIYQDSSNGYYGGYGGSLINLFGAPGYAAIGTKSTWVTNGRYDRGLLLRLAPDLDTIWTKSYSDYSPHDSSYFFHNITQTTDFGYALVGNYTNVTGSALWRIVLFKTDSLGNQQFRKFYGSGNYFYNGSEIKKTTDHGFVVSGGKYFYSSNLQLNDPIVVKFDSLGNFQWVNVFGSPGCSEENAFIDVTPDGNIQVGTYYSDSCSNVDTDYWARINLIKVRNNGSIVWDKKYGSAKWYLVLNKIALIPGGDIIVAGKYLDIDMKRWLTIAWLMRTDSAGNEKWYREYTLMQGDMSENVLYDVIPTNDQGFAACGYVFPASLPDTGFQNSWVVKVDSLGCESPGQCWVGINPINIKTFTPEKPFIIYPNPVKESLTIEFHNNDSGATAELIDQVGMSIRSESILPFKDKVNFNLNLCSNGVYFLKVRIENRYFTEKIIKL